MAHLTDAQHRTVGHTVLYIPDEGPIMASPRAHNDKDLVQRLEGQGPSLLGVSLVPRLSHTASDRNPCGGLGSKLAWSCVWIFPKPVKSGNTCVHMCIK